MAASAIALLALEAGLDLAQPLSSYELGGRTYRTQGECATALENLPTPAHLSATLVKAALHLVVEPPTAEDDAMGLPGRMFARFGGTLAFLTMRHPDWNEDTSVLLLSKLEQRVVRLGDFASYLSRYRLAPSPSWGMTPGSSKATEEQRGRGGPAPATTIRLTPPSPDPIRLIPNEDWPHFLAELERTHPKDAQTLQDLQGSLRRLLAEGTDKPDS